MPLSGRPNYKHNIMAILCNATKSRVQCQNKVRYPTFPIAGESSQLSVKAYVLFLKGSRRRTASILAHLAHLPNPRPNLGLHAITARPE